MRINLGMELGGLAGNVSGLSSVVVEANETKRRRMRQARAELKNSRLGLCTLYEPPQPIVE